MIKNTKKLIFDISFINDLSGNVTGISRVILSLINEIVKSNIHEVKLAFIDFKGTSEDYKLLTYDYIQKKSNDFLAHTYQGDIGNNIEDGDIILLLGEQWLYPNCISSIEKIKSSTNVIIVSMLYDFVPFIMPEFYWKGFPESYKGMIENVINITDSFLFISEHTKRDFVKFFPEKADENKMNVIRLGDNINSIKKNKNFKKMNYILSVSTIQPRKNHMLLLYVWKRLIEEYGAENAPTLKIVGKKGWNVDDFYYYIENNHILKEKIKIIDSVSEVELDKLYKETLFTIYPSFYEGWGLPICESLSYGKLCLSSSTSSMKEAGGDLCEYFSPYSTDELYNLVIKYYFNQNELTYIENKIKEKYRVHSWVATAKVFLNIIEKAGNGK